jgi:hypothetical protein
MPLLVSACSIRSCRARSSIPMVGMSGAGWDLIRRPWRAAPLELKGAGVELGKTYPAPIIDHRAGRERALKAYATLRPV